MTSFWTPQLMRDFHCAVSRLHRLTETPSKAELYRDRPMSELKEYLVSFRDELQIVDNLAFLSHQNEGVGEVSTVTLQEHSSGIVILLASNSPRSQDGIQGLRDVADILRDYAELRKGRQVFGERLFDKVLQLNEKRITARLRPPWVQQPSYMRKKRPFLGDLLKNSISHLKRHVSSEPRLGQFIAKLENLVRSMEPLQHRSGGETLKRLIKTIIENCVAVASIGDASSVEDHLKSFMTSSVFRRHEAADMRQIDKLARYWFLCRDLIRVCRKQEYTDLFKNIRAENLEAPCEFTRDGASHTCFVHAEIQQVLYYEHYPHQPLPRAIGCSKSACYLCDLFITTQDRYRISHCHRRLYDKWTLPDIDWMTTSQIQEFRNILRRMIRALGKAADGHQGRPAFTAFPIESRAFLPLSSGSTISQAIVVKQESYVSESEYNGALKALSIGAVTSSLQITHTDLPFIRQLHTGQVFLNINLDMLSLSFEFMRVSKMLLTIKEAQASSLGLRTINAFTLPTESEVELRCSDGAARLEFRLEVNRNLSIDIEFHWLQ